MKSFIRIAAVLCVFAAGPVVAQSTGATLGGFRGNVMVRAGADFVSAERGQPIALGQEIVVGDEGRALLQMDGQTYDLGVPGTYHVTPEGGVVDADGRPVPSAGTPQIASGGDGGGGAAGSTGTQPGGGSGGGSGGGLTGNGTALLGLLVGGAAWAENNAGSSEPIQPVSR